MISTVETDRFCSTLADAELLARQGGSGRELARLLQTLALAVATSDSVNALLKSSPELAVRYGVLSDTFVA